MRFSDCLKYSVLILKNDKRRSVLSIIICFLLSVLTMGCLYIGFTYYNNMLNVEDVYLKNNPLEITISRHDSLMLEYSKKYKASRVIGNTSYAIYVDFNKEDINLIDGRFLTSYNELICKNNTEYKLGDVIFYDNADYKICGIYDNEFDSLIGDINYIDNGHIFDSVCVVYNSANLKNINKLISKLIEKSTSLYTADFDRILTFHKYGFLVVAVSILIAIILFISSIGFFANSFIMSLNQSKKLLLMLNLCGLNKKNTIIIESLYGIFISLIGNFIGYIFVLIISSVINLDSFFMFTLKGLYW